MESRKRGSALFTPAKLKELIDCAKQGKGFPRTIARLKISVDNLAWREQISTLKSYTSSGN